MPIPSKRPDQNADTVLPAVANAVAPTYTEGDAVPLSVDLNGAVRTSGAGGAGDASAANQTTQITSLQLLDDVVAATGAAIPAKGNAVAGTDGTNARILKTDASGELQVDVLTMPSVAVTNAGTFATQAAQSGTWNVTNVSGTVSLPTGAATAAKQPALGTAGSSSTDVISVQGIASGTALPVSLASVPSHAVTNAGTFATQATLQTGSNTIGALTANQSVNVAQINGVTTTMGNGASGTGVQRVTLANDSTGVLATVSTVTAVSTLTGGGVAHDGVDSGNPHKIGAKAETSPKGITLVADADRTDLYADADGLMMVKLNTSGADAISEAVSNTDGASTAFTNFSAVASTKNYITAYTAFRTDAGSTMAYIDLRDGTAGSVLWRIPLPPTGGAVSPPYNGPCLFKTSANTALAFDVSSALTTVYISVAGYQSKV